MRILLLAVILCSSLALSATPAAAQDHLELFGGYSYLRPTVPVVVELGCPGGALPCALNAADEVAVGAFLENRLPFLGIPEVIERVLSRTPRMKFASMDDVLAADAEARRQAAEEVARLSAAKSAAW